MRLTLLLKTWNVWMYVQDRMRSMFPLQSLQDAVLRISSVSMAISKSFCLRMQTRIFMFGDLGEACKQLILTQTVAVINHQREHCDYAGRAPIFWSLIQLLPISSSPSVLFFCSLILSSLALWPAPLLSFLLQLDTINIFRFNWKRKTAALMHACSKSFLAFFLLGEDQMTPD